MRVDELQPAPGAHRPSTRVGRGKGGKRGLSAEEFTPKGLLAAYNESRRGPLVVEEVR